MQIPDFGGDLQRCLHLNSVFIAKIKTILNTHVLIDDAINLHGLHDVRDELWVRVGVPDLLVEQRTHTTLQGHTLELLGVLTGHPGYTQCKTPQHRTLNLGLIF